MLFNSYEFIFLYLPVALAGFFVLARLSQRWAAAWLALASLFFYGWWNPVYVPLLVGSILFNYYFGMAIAGAVARGAQARSNRLLTLAVAGNLLLLGYFKYANFFLDSANAVLGTGWSLGEIVLPLGISFFTFTQIAFLVDTWQGKVREYNLVHYGLFVTYFPHLIAGPVLHHAEMMPQFDRPRTYRPAWGNLAVGFTVFAIGLFKKVVLADGIGRYVAAPFDAAARGEAVPLLDAWFGTLAYTFQLYFDFSGYSDMAIGLSLLFGVRLPLNFHSPYKAVNIVDFWRRWHMTLSRFLRDYLYIPLGGNRFGGARRYANLMVTMLLGGLWHGAGWTFVVWGGLHGLYLVVNHAWHAIRRALGQDPHRSTRAGRIAGCAVTFLAVMVGWVFFRAQSMEAAGNILAGMTGGHGVVFPYRWEAKLGALAGWLAGAGVEFRNTTTFGGGSQLNWTLILAAVVWLAPNTQQLVARYRPALAPAGLVTAQRLAWRPTRPWAFATAAIFAWSILSLTGWSEFIYFQF